MTHDRTAVPYPTPGPGDGRTWHEYFKDIKNVEPLVEDTEEEEQEDEEQFTITVPARDLLETDPLPLSLFRYIELLHKNGWEVRAFYAQAIRPQLYYKAGDKKGEPRPDRPRQVHHTMWANAAKNGKRFDISYLQVDDRKPVCTVRAINKLLVPVSDAEAKSFIKGLDAKPTDS